MADYTSIIEQIKQSDSKIYVMTKQIKEMEAEIKKTENETDIIRAKNKQILQDIKYKKKILDDKTNELNIRQKELDIWAEMKNEKEKQLDDTQKELEEIQKNVFNSRIKFLEKSYEFLNECDFLVTKSHDIESAVKRRKEENKLLNDINKLEREISMLETQQQQLHKEFELLQDLESKKAYLEKEPECGDEFKRIQAKIDSCEEKLEDLDTMHATTQTPHLVNLRPNFATFKSLDNSTQFSFYGISDKESFMEESSVNYVYQNHYKEQDIVFMASGFVNYDEVLPSQENKKKEVGSFTPKIPSNLAKKY